VNTVWPKTIVAKTGVSQRKLVRDQVENAKACSGAQGFMRPAVTALSRSTARTSVSTERNKREAILTYLSASSFLTGGTYV
jgi:hypothetical protein